MNEPSRRAGRRYIIMQRIAAAAIIAAVFGFLPPPVYATGDTATSSQTVSSSVSSDPDANVSEIIVSSNTQETLGTVSFSQANTKRIAAGKSTILYLTIKDMGYDYTTTFESSDTTIATVEYIEKRSAKVVGLKTGTVTITATVDAHSKGIKTARYVLEIGEGDGTGTGIVSQGEQTGSASVSDNQGGGIITDFNDNDLDLFSSADDPALREYAEQRRDSNATSLLLGLIGWVMIIMAAVYIFSVVIRSRTPKMNVSPGTRKRYSAGGSGSPRSGNRLLPNKYYRNLKKY